MTTSEPPPERLQAPVPCEGCDTGAPGKHYCTVCRKTMCNNCSEVHSRLMREHRVVPRSEIASGKHSTCDDHPKENYSLHCNKCKIPICIDCITGKHAGHPVTKLSVILEQEKSKLQEAISDLEQRDLENISQALTELNTDKESYQSEFTTVREKMREEMSMIKAQLDEFQSNRLRELDQAELCGLDEFKAHEKDRSKIKQAVKEQITDCREHLTRCEHSPAAFLAFMTSRKSVSTELPAKPKIRYPTFQLSRSSSVNLHDTLGKMQLSSTPQQATQSKAPTGHTLTRSSLRVVSPESISTFTAGLEGDQSICMTNDGHAWIGGYVSRELILVNIDGKILNRRKVQHRTYDLAMVADGDIIISPRGVDSKSLIRLGTDGIETTIYDAEPWWCNGVSVTSDQQILLCTGTHGRGRLMRISSDGTTVKEIYNKRKNNSAIHAVELPDKTICISDRSIPGLVVIDKDGKQINTQPLGRTNYEPWGLACDRMGNILSIDWNNNCVYIIGQNRQVKELAGTSHGIKKPRLLDIDKDDNLWTQGNGTITVVKYLV